MFDDLANRQIGDFIVQERLGRGAMSVVYRAVQQSVNRSVALKVINLNLNPLAKENYQPYFIQEAKVIATLEHIHIVPIYNYGPVDHESSFIVQRLLRGGSVADLLRDGPVDLYRALDIFIQAGQGLAHAHGRGIIHRDLKPSNILLDDLGNAYLTDFGLGKLAEVSLDLTESGNVIGTPLYASPEQILGDEIDHRSDIYSMCAILYHMLTGKPPLDIGDGGLIELIQKHMTTDAPVSMRTHDQAIPEHIDRAIVSGLSRSPANRPQSIEALAEALDVVLGRRVSQSTDPQIDMSAILPETRSRRRWLLPIAALFIAAILLVAMMALARGEPPRIPTITVVPSARGSMTDVIPEPAQIEAAKAVLGQTSFVAYLPCTLENEFQATQSRVMSERLASYGIGFRVYDSRMDRYRQITLFERARLEGAKAIILCMLESIAMNDSLAAAQQAGIPLIFMTPHDPMYGGVLVDTDNRQLGESAGQTAAQIIESEMGGSARIMLLETPGFIASDLRTEGIIAALAEDAPNATIAYRMTAATVASGQDVINDALEQGFDFDFIITFNDAAAQGAARALELAGVDPDAMPIVSINGEDAARDLIRQGRYLRATVATQRDESARIAVDAAVRLLGGGEVPQYIDVPSGEVYTGE
jgi:serine/threonine protein kinase/ABC-type sugar transport system substrate-binding protein